MSLQSAAALGDVAVVLDSLQRDPSLVSKRTADGWTGTHLACYYGHPEVLSVLLSFGADVNCTGPTGYGTPLHLATAGGYETIVTMLLANGATLDDRDAAGSALEISLLTANDDVYRLLLAECHRRQNTLAGIGSYLSNVC